MRAVTKHRSRVAAPVALAIGMAWLAIGDAGAAEIYKWKDEKGVVHYSNTPPPKDANASVLDESKGKVSVVPAYKAPDAPRGANDAELQERVRRLERDLERERQSQSAAAQSQSDAYARWRADCLAQRRSDCDDPSAAGVPVYGEGGYYYPQVVRPPGTGPALPNRPSGAPPGYTVGPGPGGIGGAYVPNPPRPVPNPSDGPPGPRPTPLPR